MAIQGRVLSESAIRKIISLLASTEMTIPDIAKRMGCSRSTVVSVNRHYGIRNYAGSRSTWTVSAERLGR